MQHFYVQHFGCNRGVLQLHTTEGGNIAITTKLPIVSVILAVSMRKRLKKKEKGTGTVGERLDKWILHNNYFKSWC